jgi:hypothetical protein
MSRTRKDIPYWVMCLKYGIIEHDHRYGYCKIKIPMQGSFTYPWDHLESCPRVLYRKEICRGDCYYSLMLKLIEKKENPEEISRCLKIHSYKIIDESIDCQTCDEQVANCVYKIPPSSKIDIPIYGNPPRWWRKNRRHKPRRVDEVNILGELKKEINNLGEFDSDEIEEMNWEPPVKRREGYWD